MNEMETVVAKIIFGVDEDGFVYVRVNSGQWKLHYIYRDYQGSVTDITDASGTVVHRMRYSPWGKLQHTDGTPFIPEAKSYPPTMTDCSCSDGAIQGTSIFPGLDWSI